MNKIGVVIPACNEEAFIERCFLALKKAQFEFYQYLGSSENIPEITIISCDFRSVGKTRHLGVQKVIEQGCDWICCTDADSSVQEDWFKVMWQHQPTDAICGVVDVDEWKHLSLEAQLKYLGHYQDKMDHRHIHGANLCFKTSIYNDFNGFRQLDCHEDVDFVRRLQQAGVDITWSNQLRVATSSRLQSKVAEGFACFLQNLELQEAMKKPISVYK